MSVETAEEVVELQDCAVCLQKCHYPTQLPCGHIFCFLCVKGVAIQNKKCAMCRAEIPPDYLDHPVILQKVLPDSASPQSNEGYQWYYEGRNGWWKYDERSNSELEAAYAAGSGRCKLLLAGALYVIDFQHMLQVQSRDPTRRRRVKRDTHALPAKGIAGIKIMDNNPREAIKMESEETPTSPGQEVMPIIVDDSDDDDYEDVVITGITIGEFLQRISSIDLREQNANGSSNLGEQDGNGSTGLEEQDGNGSTNLGEQDGNGSTNLGEQDGNGSTNLGEQDGNSSTNLGVQDGNSSTDLGEQHGNGSTE